MVKGSASIDGLAADVAEAKLHDLAIVAGQGDRGDTGQLANMFAVRLELRVGSWQISVEVECAKSAMNVAA